MEELPAMPRNFLFSANLLTCQVCRLIILETRGLSSYSLQLTKRVQGNSTGQPLCLALNDPSIKSTAMKCNRPLKWYFFALILHLLFLANGMGADEPVIYDSETSQEKPVSGAEATAKIQLPEGFRAKLFASEPMVRNPIAMQYDSRGRLWIAENYSYAERGLRVDPNLRDRIIILEDTDGDDKADKTRVFTDRLNNLTGFAIGRGGVWAICPPQLLFLPDADTNEQADDALKVALDGFYVPTENHHNFANGLKFGPDGWLYGRAGGSSPSEVGPPGTPLAQRIPLRGGIWRYHPGLGRFEVLTHGTTNPWGMDWDEKGELFFVNTVNGHLWHLMPGAHLERLHTIDPNPVVYRMIDTIADHYHFDTGKGWAASRDGVANSLGGGHAHQGAIIYQGGRWPKAYDGRLMTVNFHGRRLNTERLERAGNGYRAFHEKDFALFGDTWFRGIDMAHSPDGNMAVIDWSDTGECHENTGVHRSSGRIYLLQSADDREMAFQAFQKSNIISELQSDKIFYARRSLERFQFEPEKYLAMAGQLKALMSKAGNLRNRLRAMWALNALGRLSEAELISLTGDSDEHLRGWAVRLLVDLNEIDTVLGDRRGLKIEEMKESTQQRLLSMAKDEKSGLVRSILASALQRMPVGEGRIRLAALLAGHSQDAGDISQPLLVWYGVAPVAEKQPHLLVSLLKSSHWPVLNEMIARRLSTEMQAENATAAVDEMIRQAADGPEAGREAILRGMVAGLAGRDSVKKPAGWDDFVREMKPEQVAELNEIFGSGAPEAKIRAILADSKADMRSRVIALRTLIRRRPKDLVAVCNELLGTRFLNVEAMNGLSTYDDLTIGEALIRNYRSFALLDRPKVLDVLVSRPGWAKQLLLAFGAPERISGGELSVVQARQIQALNQPELTALLEKNWGRLGTPAAEKQAFRQKIEAEMKSAGGEVDLAMGRQVYLKNCGQCHLLYGEGGRIGPDITGGQRQDLGYLLENVLEPNAVVSPDFRVTNLQMKDGRVLSGLVRARDKQAITLVGTNETRILPISEIEAQKQTTQSIMPEGQLEAMATAERVALLKYLMSSQAPEVARGK